MFELTGKEEFTETSKFSFFFDDCLNTPRAGEKRKPDLDTYRSVNDVRFEVCWCIHVFDV